MTCRINLLLLYYTEHSFNKHQIDLMNGFLGDGKGAANPLAQLGNRQGVDRSLFQVSCLTSSTEFFQLISKRIAMYKVLGPHVSQSRTDNDTRAPDLR